MCVVRDCGFHVILTEPSADIMCVNVERKNGAGVVQQVVQKMVAYKLYERSQMTVYEQQQAITILTQKVSVRQSQQTEMSCPLLPQTDRTLGQFAETQVSAHRRPAGPIGPQIVPSEGGIGAVHRRQRAAIVHGQNAG